MVGTPLTATFVVPGAPVPKKRARSTRSGLHYTPADTRAYEALVRVTGRTSLRDMRWPKTLRYSLRLHVVEQNRLRRDLSNVVKSIEDGLIGVAWEDDSQVDALHVTRAWDPKRPRVEVTLSVLEDA